MNGIHEVEGSIPFSSTRIKATRSPAISPSYYVYILECVDKTLYVGQTQDLRKRLFLHEKGSVRWTRSRLPIRLAYFEELKTRKDAMWREWELKKKWNLQRKRKMMEGTDKARLLPFLRNERA
ncbi:MAG: GIY-YIG nuclease family protein [Bacteroidota bacterium]